MNIVSVQDEEFKKSKEYQEFITINSGKGNLKIRAYAASEAIPVEGLHITVSTDLKEEKVIFFDGETDASGMIQTLSLPAPPLELNNLQAPLSTLYHITATSKMSLPQEFLVNMYDGICVVQNINFTPGGQNGY